MAASLGWMSRNGLFPTPIDTISFKRSSETQTGRWMRTEIQTGSDDKQDPSVSTFVPGGLGPEDPGDVGSPGVFDVLCGGLQDEGLILGCPPPEPDLKA